MSTATTTPPPANRLSLSLLALGLGLGLLADQLMRAMPWGLNFTLCTLAFCAAGAWAVRHFRLPVSADTPWLAFSAVLCAVAFVRRDSEALHLLDVGALIGAIAFTALAAQGASVRLRGISAYVIAVCVGCANAWFGGIRLVLGDIPWRDLQAGGRWRHVGAVAVGLLVAVPLLLVFGGLFVSADAAFAAFVSSIHVDLETVTSHVFLVAVFAGLSAGTLRGAFLGSARIAALGERLESPGVRFTTTATALAALDLLFLLFVALQARWLFGGAGVIEATTGLTVSEYARRGFFELVTAAALVIPLLLVADWATLRENRREEQSFRALALLLVLLVGALLASALQRMLLYVRLFGLTELRLYTTAFMVLLGGVSAWLAWTVLRGARARFAFGALVQTTAVLAGLHIANPDALIARVNLGRDPGAVPLDATYVAGALSADAVPVLLASLPRLGAAERAQVARCLLERWGAGSHRGRDWRSWNWSASRALTLVHERRAALETVLTPGPGPCRPRD
jgi:uncharacterized protein DUF4153